MGASDCIVESQCTGSAIGSAKASHPARVAQSPALASSLHPRLQHVTMGALDCAAADWESFFAQQAILHP
jgi:hypothetical protein